MHQRKEKGLQSTTWKDLRRSKTKRHNVPDLRRALHMHCTRTWLRHPRSLHATWLCNMCKYAERCGDRGPVTIPGHGVVWRHASYAWMYILRNSAVVINFCFGLGRTKFNVKKTWVHFFSLCSQRMYWNASQLSCWRNVCGHNWNVQLYMSTWIFRKWNILWKW